MLKTPALALCTSLLLGAYSTTPAQQSAVLGEQSVSRIHAMSLLPPQRPIAFIGRDGLALHGYRSTPIDANGSELKNVPTVVLVHGGPCARDFSRGDYTGCAGASGTVHPYGGCAAAGG